MPKFVLRAAGWREDVPDRLGAVSREVVTVDDVVGRALDPSFEESELVTIGNGIVAVSPAEARAIARSKTATF